MKAVYKSAWQLIAVLALLLQPADARPQTTASAGPVVQNGVDLEQFVAQSRARVEEYQKTFRNLTAEETKIIEVYGPSGEVEKRRQIVSDYLVYYSSRDGKDAITEYRDVQSVNGNAVGRRGEQALKLLTNASRARSLEKELKTIDRETYRYDFGKHLAGVAINPAGVPVPRDAFPVESVSREQIAGHDVVVIAYRQKAMIPAAEPRLPLPRELRHASLRRRGWIWLDVQTGQLWRSVLELVVAHPAVPDPLVMIRFERTYAASRFGILVPERFVFDWLLHFSHPKNGNPSFGLTERATYTYGSFKRFQVATEEKIDTPEANDRQ